VQPRGTLEVDIFGESVFVADFFNTYCAGVIEEKMKFAGYWCIPYKSTIFGSELR
jgi:hypothetical protein